MSLTKVIAGYFAEWKEELKNKDGTSYFETKREWVPQKDEILHPLEEAELLAGQKLAEFEAKMPKCPSIDEEHTMLIEQGIEYVRKAREEYKSLHAEWLKNYQDVMTDYRQHAQAYEDHFNSIKE
jgi:hypothetical protein